MMPQYRYTVCMDDASKLCGYSEQVFIGTSIALQDYALLLIFQEPGNYTNINFARVRWYRKRSDRSGADTMTLNTVEHIELAHTELKRAVFGYLNAILPDDWSDDDVDAARDLFIAVGTEAVRNKNYLKLVKQRLAP